MFLGEFSRDMGGLQVGKGWNEFRKLGKKHYISQSTAAILEAFGFVIESKQLEVWKCRPFLKQNGSMECRFYVICVFFARSLRKNIYYIHKHPLTKMYVKGGRGTWRIIPVSKWLVTPIYKPFSPFGRGISLLRGLTNYGY